MKLSDIVYPIIKPNAEFGMTIYQRKIFFSNAHRIPTDRPVLLISNHPTAFLEPVIYCSLLDKPIHSLVRGDLFQNSTAKIALAALNLIPIYRMQDAGVEGLRKNAETFQYCYDLLAAQQQVLIMAEGLTKHQKRLGTLQKGAARLALGAAQGRKLEDLVIIPIGTSFTSANTFRGEAMVQVGEPMEIKEYLKTYRKDKKGTIDGLTADMTVALKSTIVHLDEDSDEALFEKIIPIARRNLSSTLWPSWVKSEVRFRLEKNWANKINALRSDEKSALLKQIDGYPNDIELRSNQNLINGLILFIGFPFWLIGRIYRFIPFSIVRQIVKNKVESIEFESPIRFGMGMLFTILFTFLMFAVVLAVAGIKLIWLPLFMLLVIWFSVVYDDLWGVIKQSINWNKLSKKEKYSAMTIEAKINSMI